jgi:hypothetical protein
MINKPNLIIFKDKKIMMESEENNGVILEPYENVAFESFRSGKSWKEIIQQALDWMNGSSNLNGIISISTVLCHHNNDGLVTVYYHKSVASPHNHSQIVDA